jgi:hypothetical protein
MGREESPVSLYMCKESVGGLGVIRVSSGTRGDKCNSNNDRWIRVAEFDIGVSGFCLCGCSLRGGE